MKKKYAPDEFDELALEREVAGVHRRKRPWYRPFVPLLIILIVCPLLGWGVVYLISDRTDPSSVSTSDTPPSPDATPVDEPSAQPTPTVTETVEPSETETPVKNAEAEQPAESEPAETEEPTPSQDPEPQVDTNVSISILNGSGVTGLAAQSQAQIASEGFRDSAIGNYRNALPREGTVFFARPELEPTAQRVAQLLNMNLYVLAPEATGGLDIVIVLR